MEIPTSIWASIYVQVCWSVLLNRRTNVTWSGKILLLLSGHQEVMTALPNHEGVSLCGWGAASNEAQWDVGGGSFWVKWSIQTYSKDSANDPRLVKVLLGSVCGHIYICTGWFKSWSAAFVNLPQCPNWVQLQLFPRTWRDVGCEVPTLIISNPQIPLFYSE